MPWKRWQWTQSTFCRVMLVLFNREKCPAVPFYLPVLSAILTSHCRRDSWNRTGGSPRPHFHSGWFSSPYVSASATASSSHRRVWCPFYKYWCGWGDVLHEDVSVGCALHAYDNGFGIRFEVEACAFYHMLEMTHREVYRKEFYSECWILYFARFYILYWCSIINYIKSVND